MRYFLVDNGSLRAKSVLNLRRLARELGEVSGLEIIPASLLHSSKVDPGELNGEPAINLERRIRLFLESGERAFTIIPFFIGPTGAIVDYLPERLTALRKKYGSFEICRMPFLHDSGDDTCSGLVPILAEQVRETIRAHGLNCPKVALVDHGSPLREVTKVRNSLAEKLADHLGHEVECVAPASMERREGEQYAFNEPLLENLLREPDWRNGPVVISMLFLSPGRHAGSGGDVAGICEQAMAESGGLQTHMTPLVGMHPGIISLLNRQLNQLKTRL